MTATIQKLYYVYKESLNFFMITTQLTNIIDECEKIQSGIISFPINLNHGRLNTNFLKASPLKSEISKIEDSLSENYVLPGKRTGTELTEVYTLLTARGLFVDERLIINAKIPLFGRHASKLFRVVPIPVTIGERMIMVHVDVQYLVYKFEIDAYHLIKESILNKYQWWRKLALEWC